MQTKLIILIDLLLKKKKKDLIISSENGALVPLKGKTRSFAGIMHGTNIQWSAIVCENMYVCMCI